MVVCSALKDLIDRALLAGVMAAALVIAAPAASRGQDDSAPKQSHSGRAKQARTSLGVGGAAAMISSYRKRHGLPAVRADSRLMAIARRHAHAMAAQGRMSHDVGGDFSTRLRRGGYVAAAAAENIAAGQRSLSEAFSGWVESPPHRANLLLGGATRIGIASAAAKPGSRYRTYWAMVIAAPLVVSRDQRGRVRLMAIKRGHSVQDRRDAQ